MLVLYFHPRERAAQGDFQPVCTMYQGPEDYITLERDGGKSKWRTAAFEKLFQGNYLGQSCAFFSAQDEKRVSNYFKDKDAQGFSALIKFQDAYIAARRKDRQLVQERKILDRMASVPALPDGLESWARRNVLPAHFIYRHARRGTARGVCSSCGHAMTLENVEYKGKATCPHCGREMTMAPRGRTKHIHDRETGVVIQRMGTDGLIVRILKVHARYQDGAPAITVNENARQFVGVGPDGAVNYDD